MTEKLTVTLKESKEYDAAWIVVHAESASEANAILQEIEQSADFLSTVGRVKAKFGSGAFQVGQHLGGESVVPHQNQEQLGLTQPPQPEPAYQQAPPTQPQQSYQPSNQQPQQYTPQAANAPLPSNEPVGPFIQALGQNASYKEGIGKTGKPWRRFADPRPWGVVKDIPNETDDPNHPGIGAGTHRFSAWIR